MDPQIATETPVNQAEIQKLAYYLWENAHCPPGRSLEFWLRAEQTLHTRRQAAVGPFLKAARADGAKVRPKKSAPALKPPFKTAQTKSRQSSR